MLSEVSRKYFEGLEEICVPVADGGEGTVDALLMAVGGERLTHTVTGPMGNPVSACYGILADGTAILEVAQTSGLPLVPPHARNPMKATSAGLGELMAYLIRQGIKKIVIGIGGSATNDCGMGMLRALGAKFYAEDGALLDGNGEQMALVKSADLSGLMPFVRDTDIQVMSDVNNPLLNEDGATAVYGPQKGVTVEMRSALETGMAHFAGLIEEALGHDISSFQGAGAAGGIGAALGGVLGATLKSGIEAVLDTVGFDGMLTDCDLVITGEGILDSQSVKFGKVPMGIAKRCAMHNVPVVAIVGGMGDGAQSFYSVAKDSIMTTVSAPMSVEWAMKNARALYLDAAERVFQMIRIGFDMKK